MSILRKYLFWNADTPNRNTHDPEKWFLVFLLILSQIWKNVCCVDILDLLCHCKRLIMQIFWYSLNFCIAIHWSLIYYMRNLISLKINLRSKINFDKFKQFSTMNFYNFHNVNTNVTESECKSLKELIKRKDFVIQKLRKATL